MSVINNLINDLVNKDEILSDCLFIEHSAIVSENLHHTVDDVHHKAWRNIVLGGGHKVNSKLFCKEIVQPLDVLIQFKTLWENLRMREEDHRPKGSLFCKRFRTFLYRDLVGLKVH